jgi:hypothetical protein
MAVVVLLIAVLVAGVLDARQASRSRDGFAVIELLVVVLLAARAARRRDPSGERRPTHVSAMN